MRVFLIATAAGLAIWSFAGFAALIMWSFLS